MGPTGSGFFPAESAPPDFGVAGSGFGADGSLAAGFGAAGFAAGGFSAGVFGSAGVVFEVSTEDPLVPR